MTTWLIYSVTHSLLAISTITPPDSQVRTKLPIEFIMEEAIEEYNDEIIMPAPVVIVDSSDTKTTENKVLSPEEIAIAMAETDAYIRRYAKTAVEEMQKYKIPASITLAQAILESNKGKSKLARLHNNHFGLTCAKCTTDSILYLDRLSNEMRYFQKFPNVWSSFRAHSLRIAANERYVECFKAKDYREFAQALEKCGYAEDKDYAKKIITVIENYQLMRYDALEKVIWREDLTTPQKKKKKA